MFYESRQKFPCPCCGYRVNRMPPGSHEICPICGWEDDLSQLRFPEMAGSANHVSLVRAQENYRVHGSAEQVRRVDVRAAEPEDPRDEEWRPIDPRRDNLEQPRAGVGYGDTYPQDTTILYYWRATYWRRFVS